ncbi:ATP-binding protein [Kitasatospora sp. NPDC050543]|uniref:ATP-binding protein n=1 Tax=Kitasatospora sp. NPDC050543 TaxID=3364054 RepID=UPI00378CAC20
MNTDHHSPASTGIEADGGPARGRPTQLPPERPATAPGRPDSTTSDARRTHTVLISPHPDRVRQARRMVTTMLTRWCLEHLRDDAELLTSELVTNAIRTPDQQPITVLVAHDGRWLSIAVRDRSLGLPRPTRAGWSHESGRGLFLVEHLADSWSYEAHADGSKTVSFRLAVRDGDRDRPHVPARQPSGPESFDNRERPHRSAPLSSA